MRNGKLLKQGGDKWKSLELIFHFFQSLMEKYPDVEVRVFRGGESVGENHMAGGLQNQTLI